MRVGMMGRHCLVCDKNVVDFTDRSKEELVRYLLEARGRSICGRVRPDQLDVYHDLPEVYIRRSLKANRTSNLAYYLLAIGGLSATACTSQERPDPQARPSTDAIHRSESPDTPDQDMIDDPPSIEKSAPTPPLLVGVMIVDDTDQEKAGIDPLPEVMPEFPGGQDSLYAFITAHLRYPEWESKHGIEGRVYVAFTIGMDGRVADAHIVHSVQGARNLDQEVLRVIGLMPSWIPGRNGQKVVASKLVLPINFVL